jgi:hypothetical protein
LECRVPYQPFETKYIKFDAQGNILSEKIPDNKTIIYDYVIPTIANNKTDLTKAKSNDEKNKLTTEIKNLENLKK